MNRERQPLPLGQSDFAALISSGAVYADKTDLVFELARRADKVLLVRPRRFGKSLLASTFLSLFKFGLRDFKGLAIDGRWSERTHPVVRLDFSLVSWFEDASQCRRRLHAHLEEAFGAAGFARTGRQSVLEALSSWLERLPDQSLVVLIDECDSPLAACLRQPARFEEVRRALSEFYAVLARASARLRFLFVTGILKVGSESLFAGLRLRDISLEPRFAALTGFTEAEVRRCFKPHLAHAAGILGMTEEALVSELKARYAGFCFDETAQSHVFCPWSELNFLKAPSRGFRSYWHLSAGGSAAVWDDLQSCGFMDPERFDRPEAAALAALRLTRSSGRSTGCFSALIFSAAPQRTRPVAAVSCCSSSSAPVWRRRKSAARSAGAASSSMPAAGAGRSR